MIDHILVPLDGSSLAECVLPHVVALARALHARVTLLHVLQSGRSRSTDPMGWRMRQAEVQSYLNEVAERLRQEVDLETDQVLLEGQPAEGVVNYAHHAGVSLVVLSSHGRSGLSEWNVSSVVQKVILRARIPTMIVRAYQPAGDDLAGLRYRRVLLPMDGSQRAECVLPVATSLAAPYGCQLLFAQVVSKPEMPHRMPLTEEEKKLIRAVVERNRQEAIQYLADIRSRLSNDIETRLLIGDSAAAALHELVDQENVDLVILCAHGYTGSSRWPYGSMALNFVAYGKTPLLIVQDLEPQQVVESEAEIAAQERKGH